MKLTRRELETIIENYLKEDLQEGTLGTISGGAHVTFCDLSQLPELFHTLFSAIRDKRIDKLEERLKKEKQVAGIDEAAEIQKSIDELTSKPGFLDRVVSHRMFRGLVGMMGPGITILTLKGAADCEYIIATAENLLINVIAPIFRLDIDRIKTSIDKHKANHSSEQAIANPVSGITPGATTTLFSSYLLTKNVIDGRSRKAVPQKYLKDGDINQFHLDLFELMAPEEYQEFIKDPRKPIPTSAKQKLIDSLDEMGKVHSDSIRDWEDGFLLATPGTQQDQTIKRIFRNMQPSFEDAFETPKEATKYIRKCYQELVKTLPFEGFQAFDGI